MSKRALSFPRKNQKRKKYGFFPVRLPLSLVSVYKVSVSLELLSLEVSLPLTAYLELPVISVAALERRLELANILPQGTYMHHNNCWYTN